MVVDGEGVASAPGAILLEHGEILAAGDPRSIGEPAGARIVDRRDAVVLPALVNCHCHLDLTHLGPVPYTGDFLDWIDLVRNGRATDAAGIARSVRQGVALSRAGGTAIIGDIAGAGSREPLLELRRCGLAGVSFLEVFGVGRGAAAAIEHLRRAVRELDADADGVRLGVQPHAPYSCDLSVYEAAAQLDCPMATHLAETPEELQFVDAAEGPLADLLKRLGAWDETIRGHRQHPVDLLAGVLARGPIVAAHLNYVEPHHLEMLSRWGTTVAYCPRASAYFDHRLTERPPHQYREMIRSGINVALGTDSIICVDTPDRLSVLDEMRFLYRRDGTEPKTLLAMATVNGARALGYDAELFTFGKGAIAGLLAVPIEPQHPQPLIALLESATGPEWILSPLHANNPP